jgi:hypothetical protein
MPFAVTIKPLAENGLFKTNIKKMILSAVPIHLPSLARLSASSILSRHCLVSCPVKIPAGAVRKASAVMVFQEAVVY